MPSWLVEDPTVVYFVLGFAALALTAGWWMTRLGKYAVGAVVAVALILLVRLLDYWVVTDHEKIVNCIQAMAEGVAARDMDGVFAHVSPRFRLGNLDKAGFRNWAEPHIRNGDVSSIRVWGFTKGLVDRDRGTATIEFLVKGHGTWERGGEFFRCKATYLLDPDDEWRLSGFELFQPYQDPELATPMPVPIHR